MGFRVMQDNRIMDEKKRSFDLVEHGIDQSRAIALAKTAVVIEGNFPKSEIVTGDSERVATALRNLSTDSTLFTYVASHYRGHGTDILLLDYCH